MGLFYQLLHILHGTKFLIHLPVISDIVPVVLLRGIIDRAQPDDVNSQVFQIIQLPDNPLQIQLQTLQPLIQLQAMMKKLPRLKSRSGESAGRLAEAN